MNKKDPRTMFYGAKKQIFQKAEMLRAGMTKAEHALWDRLANNQLNGFKFRRQHPIGPYVADFYCHKAKLVIEVDGKDHNQVEQKEYDKDRDFDMKEQGIKVLRFKNEEVLHDIEYVISTIASELKE